MESRNPLTLNYLLKKIILYLTNCGYPLLGFLCPENLTFPKAEHEQQCPRLVVVIFVYLFQSKILIGSRQQIINLIGRLKRINKKEQQPNVDIADHVQLLGKLDF